MLGYSLKLFSTDNPTLWKESFKENCQGNMSISLILLKMYHGVLGTPGLHGVKRMDYQTLESYQLQATPVPHYQLCDPHKLVDL